jgi:hypothetical protein
MLKAETLRAEKGERKTKAERLRCWNAERQDEKAKTEN